MSDKLLKEKVSKGWMIDGERISFQQQRLIFAAYKRFSDDGRPLAHEDIGGIAVKMLKKDKISTSSLGYLYSRLRKFDDDSDPLAMEYANLHDKNGQPILAEVGRIFRRFLEENEEAKDRSENCKGHTKRLPHMDSNDWKNWPVWGKYKIRIDQLFLGHAMANFCKDHKGQSLGSAAGKDLLQDQVFHRRPSHSSIFHTLMHGSSRLAQEVAGIMDTDEVFREHFGNLAYKKHKLFARENGLPDPRLVMPRISSQSDLGLTTTSVEDLALTAPASSSSQLTAAGRSQSKEPSPSSYLFSEFCDYDAYVSQGTEGTPGPSGVSNDDPKGEGKGKQRRERESRSNSPWGEGSGKPKEKRRRHHEGRQ